MKKPACLTAVFLAYFLLTSTASAQVIYPNRGGTGTTTTPSTGQVLVGQGTGVYAPQATATLNITPNTTGDWTGTFDGQQGTYYLDLANHTGLLTLAGGGTGTSTFSNGPVVIGGSTGLTQNLSFFYDSNLGFLGIGDSSPNAKLNIGTNVSDVSWTTTGKNFAIDANTLTDTTGNGTISNRVVNSFGIPTLSSTNPVTLTRASNVYIAGAATGTGNTTITNPYSLHVDGGNNLFDGFSGFGGINSGGSPPSVITIAGNQSAPSWTTAGLLYSNTNNQVLTDTSSAASSTIASRVASSFLVPVFAFTNSTSTITNGATVYIAGAPTGQAASTILTAPFSFWVDGGEARFDDNVQFGINASGYIAPSAITTRSNSLTAGTTSDPLRIQGLRGAVVTGNTLGGIGFETLDTNISGAVTDGGKVAAGIRALAEATHTASVVTSGLAFLTTVGDPANLLEKMRLTGAGNLGIGTTTPGSQLTVATGDIYIASSTRGVILKRPNGTCGRMTLTDASTFDVATTTCP